MTKGYLVKAVYWGGAEHPIGFCPTLELAELLRQRNENLHDLKDNEITSEIWEKMKATYHSNEENTLRPICEVLFELFPEYSVTDIEEACNEYENRAYGYTYITSIDIFTNESDIMSYGINP